MLKKISPIIICICIAFTICVSAMGFADGVSVEPPAETTVDIISVEKYLIALYEAVNNTELADKTDTTEVLAWAESNGVLESIIDDMENISNTPLTQEMALLMLSRTYSELTEITEMLAEVSHTSDNRPPQMNMQDQPVLDAESAVQPTPPNDNDFSEGRHRLQMQMPENAAENSTDMQSVSQSDSKTAENPANEQIQPPDFTTQVTDIDKTDAANTQEAPQRNGTPAGNRVASNTQGSKMQQPSGNTPQNNSANKETSETGIQQGNNIQQEKGMGNPTDKSNTKRNSKPGTDVIADSENMDFEIDDTAMSDIASGETQTDIITQTEEKAKSLNEYIEEYLTTFVGLILLAMSFIFVKLYRRRRY